MSLETRARTAAEGLRTATTVDPDTALDRLRRTHRRRNAGRAAGVGVAAAIAIVLVGPALSGDRENTEQAPAGSPSGTASPSSTTHPIDTTGWTTFSSDQYDYEVGHPPGWIELPATRSWTFARDIKHWHNSTHDAFLAPEGDVLVSAWNAPLEPGSRIDTTADVVRWVEHYCEESGSEPCSGIAERAVDLCLEARDCHPGVLVRFDADTQAFFTGGIYEADAMTVVSVWRPELDSSVAPYGGAQRLLEGFLSTMAVWPASTPFADRVCHGGQSSYCAGAG